MKSARFTKTIFHTVTKTLCICVITSALMSPLNAQTQTPTLEERRQKVAAHNAASGNTSVTGHDSTRIKEARFSDKSGTTYKKNGDNDKAIAAFSKAIALDTVNHLYYRHRGEVYAVKGDVASAVRDFTKAIQLGRDALDYKCRGDVYMAADDYEAAMRDYEEAVRLAPGVALYSEVLAKAKTMRSNIKITFTSPRVSSRSAYALGACIKSESRKVDKVVVTVNGSAQRGIGVVRDDGCDHSVSQTVSLREGENKIVVEVVLGDGETKSGVMVVTYAPDKSAPTPNAAVAPVAPISANVVDGRRAALVIGNANYKNSPLQNAVNDAKAVAAKLKGLGFDVSMATDLGNKEMKRVIDGFADKARGYDIALFFYAGHGVQYNNVNYFLPVDIGNISSLSAVEDDATSMDRLMRSMDETKASVKIVLLDACRNNPIVRGGAGGLASLNTKPEGTFIVYATAPGKIAMDNSAFTKSFLRHVDTQGLKIEDLFKKVTLDVRKDTDNFQQPWAESSITGDFYFKR